MSTIEKVNEALKGALPDNYFSCIDLDNSKLSTLLDGINKIDTQKDKDNDNIMFLTLHYNKRGIKQNELLRKITSIENIEEISEI